MSCGPRNVFNGNVFGGELLRTGIVQMSSTIVVLAVGYWGTVILRDRLAAK